MFCIRKVPPPLFTQFKKSYNKFQARFYSANYKLFILKSFDEYNALTSENNEFQITSEKKSRKLLNLGEELINEFIELKRNNEIIMNEKLTFKEGYLIPNEIWNFIELYLERIFKCLRITKNNVDTSFELAIEVRNNLEILKSICEYYNIHSLMINNKNLLEEEEIIKLKHLIIKLEEECELFELSEKIKELDIRLTNLMNLSENKENNLLQQDNVDEEMDDTFIKLETPRIIFIRKKI
ncbi:hypothetical protein ABK040_015938 [Willaertia magna]